MRLSIMSNTPSPKEEKKEPTVFDFVKATKSRFKSNTYNGVRIGKDSVYLSKSVATKFRYGHVVVEYDKKNGALRISKTKAEGSEAFRISSSGTISALEVCQSMQHGRYTNVEDSEASAVYVFESDK